MTTPTTPSPARFWHGFADKIDAMVDGIGHALEDVAAAGAPA